MSRLSRVQAKLDGRCHCWQCDSLPNHEVFDNGMKCRGCNSLYLSVCCYNLSRRCIICIPSPILDSFYDSTTVADVSGLVFDEYGDDNGDANGEDEEDNLLNSSLLTANNVAIDGDL